MWSIHNTSKQLIAKHKLGNKYTSLHFESVGHAKILFNNSNVTVIIMKINFENELKIYCSILRKFGFSQGMIYLNEYYREKEKSWKKIVVLFLFFHFYLTLQIAS